MQLSLINALSHNRYCEIHSYIPRSLRNKGHKALTYDPELQVELKATSQQNKKRQSVAERQKRERARIRKKIEEYEKE